MPRRFIKRRTYRKRSSRYAKRGYVKRRALVARRRRRPRRSLPLAGYPKRKMVRLRYVDEITMDAGAAGIQKHTFSANGMYDTDITGVGHQPHGFDQMMLAYDHYTVLGAKCTVTFIPAVTTPVVPGYFGVFVDDDSTLNYGGAKDLLESAQGKGKIVLAGNTNDGNHKRVTRYFSAKKFFGKKYMVGAEGYRGSTSANPTEGAFFQIWHAAIGGTDPGAVTMLVEIEFIAMLTEPKYLAQS